jgi:hypothetical protein
MPTDFFFLVGQIVTEKKYFHCSLGDISQHLEADGHCEVEAEHHTEDDYSTVHTVLLRLNISCKNKTNTTSWSVALKLHNIRIDGIDSEPVYPGMDGTLYQGWHRRVWNHRHQSAERNKIPVADLDVIKGRDHFLNIVFNLMGILLDRNDHGPDELQFD